MTEEHSPEMIQLACDIVYAIVAAGGMANKSLVEDVMMARVDGLDRYTAHDLMNHLEFYGIHRFPMRRRFKDGEVPPSLADFPEVAELDSRYPRYAQRSKA